MIVCILIDTGAEISLINDTLAKKYGFRPTEFDRLPAIKGLGNTKVPLLGIFQMNMELLGLSSKTHSFGVIDDKIFSYCFLFGWDLLESEPLIVDFITCGAFQNNSLIFKVGSQKNSMKIDRPY